jgi:hypothetical protein
MFIPWNRVSSAGKGGQVSALEWGLLQSLWKSFVSQHHSGAKQLNTRSPSHWNCGYRRELDAGVGGFELPIGLDVMLVAIVLPGGDLLDLERVAPDATVDGLNDLATVGEYKFAGRWTDGNLKIWRGGPGNAWSYTSLDAPDASLAQALKAFDAIYSWNVSAIGDE